MVRFCAGREEEGGLSGEVVVVVVIEGRGKYRLCCNGLLCACVCVRMHSGVSQVFG